MITYILPCAGSGTRLGLPYPKELHRILPGKSLIDFSLEHIRVKPELTEKVVVVVSPGKESVAEYVRGSVVSTVAIETAYFNKNYKEWPGSIKSAEEYFGDMNVALLPDSILMPFEEESLGGQFSQAFESGADVVFAFKEEKRPEYLRSLGALYVDGGRVQRFCDKPNLDDAVQYNAYWAAFGFRKSAGVALLDLMGRSVSREAVDLGELNLQVLAFPIKDYTDLGTWPAVSRFLSSPLIARLSE